MTDYTTWLHAHLQKLYERNPFVALLDMKVVSFARGESTISMPVIAEKHTNLYARVHGGALASMVDTAMGVACATTGNRVVTLEMNLNFMKNAQHGSLLTATGKIIHQGKTTIVTEAEIYDDQNNLLVKARGTFFIIGRFEDDEHE